MNRYYNLTVTAEQSIIVSILILLLGSIKDIELN